MLLEIDEVAVPTELWVRVRHGNKQAIEALQEMIDGLEIYMHAFGCGKDDTIISLRQLERAGVAGTVVIRKKQIPLQWGPLYIYDESQEGNRTSESK